MVIIKKHFNAKLNDVEKVSQEYIQQLRTALEHAEKSPEISNQKKCTPRTLISEFIAKASDAYISSLPDSIAFQEKSHEKIHSDIQAWTAEANELFQAAKDTGYLTVNQLDDYLKSNPPSAGAIAMLVFMVQDKFKRESASTRAKAVRKKNEKEAALQLWNDWQNNPGKYKNKQAFIKKMVDSTSTKVSVPISQNTARDWFDEFRVEKSCSQEWKKIHGTHYPTNESSARLGHKLSKKKF